VRLVDLDPVQLQWQLGVFSPIVVSARWLYDALVVPSPMLVVHHSMPFVAC